MRYLRLRLWVFGSLEFEAAQYHFQKGCSYIVLGSVSRGRVLCIFKGRSNRFSIQEEELKKKKEMIEKHNDSSKDSTVSASPGYVNVITVPFLRCN